MKQLLYLLLLFTMAHTVNAQDLIVTRHTLLPLDKVTYYQKDYYTFTSVSPEDVKSATAKSKEFNLAIHGGWSYRTASAHPDLSSELREHYKGLRSGYHIGADAVLYFSETIGAGLKYSMARFQNNLGSTIEDNITLQYIGPAVFGRLISANQKTHFTYDLSIGYLHYKDKAHYNGPITLSGGALGLGAGIGVDFKLSEQFFLGFSTSYNSGVLNQIKVDNGQQTETIELAEEERENLDRIDVALRLKWRF